MDSGYDLTKKRPIEIRVIDRREDGGVSEETALQSNGITADVLLVMRTLIDDGAVSVSYSAIEGWTGGEVSFEALFGLWLAFTGHLAHYKTQDATQEAMRAFAERVLNLMRLSVDLSRLQADQVAEPAAEA